MPDLVEREEDLEEQGAHVATVDEQGAQDAEDLEEQGEQDAVPRYTLRTRANPRNSVFQNAMDKPQNSKSYFPPMQLLYKDVFTYFMTQAVQDTEFAITLTQMSSNAGLKKYGKKAKEAILAEFAQLEDDLEVYDPLDPSKLTRTVAPQSHQPDQGEAVWPTQGPHRC